MRRLVICVLAVLTGSSRSAGQSVLPPVLLVAGGAASAHLVEGPGNEASQSTRHPANWKETPTGTRGSVHPGSAAAASEPTNADLQAHPDTPPVPGPEGGASLTREAPIAFSSPPSTDQPPSESLVATQRPLTSATGGGPAGPAQQDVPPLLNVGDEDTKGPGPSSPLDPLLAGLMSVFIVATAVVFVILFLRFRQRTSHPEFQRLQDLPMDDLMEDTPLSRFSH